MPRAPHTRRSAAKRERDQQRLHAEIARQASRLRSHLERTPYPPAPGTFPELDALHNAAMYAWHCLASTQKSRAFQYKGKRYRLGVTTVGRIVVIDPATGLMLAAGQTLEAL